MEVDGEENRGGVLPAVAEEAEEQQPGSSATMERVAAAKKFIENHYKSQMKTFQERRERYRRLIWSIFGVCLIWDLVIRSDLCWFLSEELLTCVQKEKDVLNGIEIASSFLFLCYGGVAS